MKILLALLFATLGVAQARPLVIQESARLDNPDTSYPDFARAVAIDGDDALVTLNRYVPSPPEAWDEDEMFTSVWLFRRVNGAWSPVRELVNEHNYSYNIWPDGLAMQNGVAALAIDPLQIYEKRNGDWVRATINEEFYSGPGDDVEIDQGRVLFGGTSGTWMGTLLETQPGSGVWNVTSRMLADERGGDDEHSGGPVDISGDYAVVLSPYCEGCGGGTPSVTLFLNWGPPRGYLFWTRLASNPLGYETAIRGEDVFITGSNRTGTRIFRRQPSGQWPETEKLLPLDAHMGAGETNLIRKSDLFVMQQVWSADRQAYVIHVYSRNGAVYDQVATLAASSGVSLGAFAISGRRVIASCGNTQACIFELPASFTLPALVQDTFAGTSPTGWSLSTGSQFSIVQSGVSRVLRQAETASTATHAAVLTASNWSNQSVEADIKPTAFNGNDRWFGLATRYRDASNNYYVTVRASGSVSLRKNVNGSFTNLASAPLAVTLNRSYRVRLESIGTRHRVFVDDRLLLEAFDGAIASGRAALLTYRAAAEFDNVMASPTPATSMYASHFGTDPHPVPEDVWEPTGQGQWFRTLNGQEPVFAQGSVAGDARNAVGVPTDAQSVSVRVRPTTFAGTGSGDRWFGVMARYTNESNYYYLSLRSNNTVSLRKLTGGTISVLASAPLPVNVGSWYSLRIEAVGTQLRGYVNGALVLETSDSTHAQGSTGLVTYRAAAQFDDFRAVQP